MRKFKKKISIGLLGSSYFFYNAQVPWTHKPRSTYPTFPCWLQYRKCNLRHPNTFSVEQRLTTRAFKLWKSTYTRTVRCTGGHGHWLSTGKTEKCSWLFNCSVGFLDNLIELSLIVIYSNTCCERSYISPEAKTLLPPADRCVLLRGPATGVLPPCCLFRFAICCTYFVLPPKLLADSCDTPAFCIDNPLGRFGGSESRVVFAGFACPWMAVFFVEVLLWAVAILLLVMFEGLK